MKQSKAKNIEAEARFKPAGISMMEENGDIRIPPKVLETWGVDNAEDILIKIRAKRVKGFEDKVLVLTPLRCRRCGSLKNVRPIRRICESCQHKKNRKEK